jgi:chemotaxis protein histidine kinase CheA
MSETDFAPHSFDPGPLSWVMGEVREALGRSRTALFEAGGLEPEYQATALRLAKSHLQQAHGALQMADAQGATVITQLAEDALDRFKDGSVKCSADHVQAVGRLYGALVDYLEGLLDGAAPQPVRLFPHYAAVQRMLGAPRVHPADLFFPDLAREPALAAAPDGAAAQADHAAPVDYAALRQRFERALLPYLRSGEPAQAGPLAEVIAEVAAAQEAPRGRAFWLALQAFAELVAQGHVPGGVDAKQLFGAANLQMRRLAQGAPECPEAVLRDALFFIAAARPEELTPLARELRTGFALDGTVPSDYMEERPGRPAGEAGGAAPGRQAVDLPQDEALAQRMKAALRDVERALEEGGTAGLDDALQEIEGALAQGRQGDAQAAMAHLRRQVAALEGGEPAERDRIAQNVEALGFFADMLAQNAAGARERFAFDAAQGTFRTVPLRKIPGAESIPVLDEAVPAPESQAGPLAGIVAAPGASDPAIEAELLEIFIAEAQEMLALIDGALARPRAEAGTPDGLAALRRSFHALKGSGRMVGLNGFADAAFVLEKVLGAWLADGRSANEALFGLLEWTAAELNAWVGELVAKGISPRGAAPVVAAAAQVLEGRPFVSPDAKPLPAEPPAADPYVTDENATEETAAAAPEMAAAGTAPPATPDEGGMRFVGRLAVPATQFDIFVAEASALAGALARDIDTWRRHGELDPEALHLAHALADTSGAVGFKALRELAAALDATLQAAPRALHDPAQHDLFDLAVKRMGTMLDSFAAGEMPPEQPELVAALARLREELARAQAAGHGVAARLDGMLAAPDAAEPAAGPIAEPVLEPVVQPVAEPAAQPAAQPAVEPVVEPVAEPAADELATRLDTLFADTYRALLAEPPPVPERGTPLPLRPQLATQDESIDDLFNAAFDDAFAAPPLTQAAAPQLTLVPPVERPPETAQATDESAAPARQAGGADVPAQEAADDATFPVREPAAALRLEDEMASLRRALAGADDKLDTLRRQLQEVQSQAGAHIAARLSVAGEGEFDSEEFDRLTQLQESARGMAGSVDDVAALHAALRRAADTIAGLLPAPGESGER